MDRNPWLCVPLQPASRPQASAVRVSVTSTWPGTQCASGWSVPHTASVRQASSPPVLLTREALHLCPLSRTSQEASPRPERTPCPDPAAEKGDLALRCYEGFQVHCSPCYRRGSAPQPAAHHGEGRSCPGPASCSSQASDRSAPGSSPQQSQAPPLSIQPPARQLSFTPSGLTGQTEAFCF